MPMHIQMHMHIHIHIHMHMHIHIHMHMYMRIHVCSKIQKESSTGSTSANKVKLHLTIAVRHMRHEMGHTRDTHVEMQGCANMRVDAWTWNMLWTIHDVHVMIL